LHTIKTFGSKNTKGNLYGSKILYSGMAGRMDLQTACRNKKQTARMQRAIKQYQDSIVAIASKEPGAKNIEVMHPNSLP